MVKPLLFKGDKKPKKRKASRLDDGQSGLADAGAKRQTVQNAIEENAEDDSWVAAEAANDLTGPVILVLPSNPPTCIACDTIGKVFPSELENMIDGNPSTAEPHDVRQVWIVNRVAGAEEFTFKGHHGRYLSSDEKGLLNATREAISPEESFLCVLSENAFGSTFSLQTSHRTFVAVNETGQASSKNGVDVKADADASSDNTAVRIRMQARFKPTHTLAKEQRVKEKISRKELEEVVGRRLGDDEVKRLKKARRTGDYHEAILDVRVKGKADKYA